MYWDGPGFIVLFYEKIIFRLQREGLERWGMARGTLNAIFRSQNKWSTPPTPDSDTCAWSLKLNSNIPTTKPILPFRTHRFRLRNILLFGAVEIPGDSHSARFQAGGHFGSAFFRHLQLHQQHRHRDEGQAKYVQLEIQLKPHTESSLSRNRDITGSPFDPISHIHKHFQEKLTYWIALGGKWAIGCPSPPPLFAVLGNVKLSLIFQM